MRADVNALQKVPFPPWVSICPFLLEETLSGRQASLGVAMVMAMMSLGSKSNCQLNGSILGGLLGMKRVDVAQEV